MMKLCARQASTFRHRAALVVLLQYPMQTKVVNEQRNSIVSRRCHGRYRFWNQL